MEKVNLECKTAGRDPEPWLRRRERTRNRGTGAGGRGKSGSELQERERGAVLNTVAVDNS